jgi:hypothetical protein
LLGDPFAYVNWIVLVPLFIVLLTRLLLKIEMVRNSFSSGQLIQNARKADLGGRLRSGLDSRRIPLVGLVGALVIFVFTFFLHPCPEYHWSSAEPARFFLCIEGALKTYLVITIGLRVVLFLVFLYRVFQQVDETADAAPKVRLTYTDEYGGLGVLVGVASAANVMLVALGLNMVSGLAARLYNTGQPFTPTNILQIVAYAVLTPAVFAYPLMLVHRNVKQAKERDLDEVEGKIRKAMEDPDDWKSNADRLKAKRDMIAQVRVTPFKAGVFGKILTLFITPIVVAVVSNVMYDLLKRTTPQ